VLVKVVRDEKSKIAIDQVNVARNGFVLDPLLDNPDYFLYAGDSLFDENTMLIYSLKKNDFKSAVSNQAFQQLGAKLQTLRMTSNWITNSSGEIVALVRQKDGKNYFQIKKGGKYVGSAEIDTSLYSLVAISEDFKRVYAVTENNLEQRSLVSLDASSMQDQKTVFTQPGKDILSVVLGRNRQPEGVRYIDEGMLITHYFDQNSIKLHARLKNTIPGASISEFSRSYSGKQSLVYVEASNNPGDLYYFDQERNELSKIDQQLSAKDSITYAPSLVLNAVSKDGWNIEGYLTVPSNNSAIKKPLIVLPHGGPIGIRDHRGFDKEVQFLASQGYAVLTVNYRGSEGFGTKFREAGKLSLGTLIEDDIQAMVDVIIRRPDIDSSRMCIMGTSYGGYSALVAVSRKSNPYRCAISISGPSDRVLQFTASDSAMHKEGRKFMTEYFGDPIQDSADLQAVQPIYNYKDIKVPVMLIHGTEDRRVDIEQSNRMQRMLSISGNIPVMLTLKGEEHGLRHEESIRLAWLNIAAFLQESLH
jgi:dienelactone hydrolase